MCHPKQSNQKVQLTGKETIFAPCFAASLINFVALDKFSLLFEPTANCIRAKRISKEAEETQNDSLKHYVGNTLNSIWLP